MILSVLLQKKKQQYRQNQDALILLNQGLSPWL